MATIAALSPTSAHAVAQVTNLDLLTAAPIISDIDGDHLNNATVTIAGRMAGRQMRVSTWKIEAPSMTAASSISRGTASKLLRIM